MVMKFPELPGPLGDVTSGLGGAAQGQQWDTTGGQFKTDYGTMTGKDTLYSKGVDWETDRLNSPTLGRASTGGIDDTVTAIKNLQAGTRTTTPTAVTAANAVVPVGGATYAPATGNLVNAPTFAAFNGSTIPGAPSAVGVSGPATTANIGNVGMLSNQQPIINAGQAQAQGQNLGANLVQGTQLTGEGQDIRAQQMQLADAIRAQAAGTAPSAAEIQLKQAQDRAIASQSAMAANAKGSPALAQRQAAINTANLQQSAGAEAAKLRMQEQDAAQKQLADIYGTTRAADITVASKNADMTQQASLANQTALNDLQVQQAKLAQEATNLNASLQTTTNVEQQKLLQANLQQNQQTQMQLKTKQADLEQRTIELNKNAQDAALKLQAELNQASAIKAAEIGSTEKQFAAGQQLTAGLESAKLSEAGKQFAAQQAQTLALENAKLQQQADIANQAAKLTAQGLDDQQVARIMGIEVDKLKAALGAETEKYKADQAIKTEQYKAASQQGGAGIGAAGSIIAAMISTATEKKNIMLMDVGGTDEEEKERQRKRRMEDAILAATKQKPEGENSTASAISSGGSAIAAAIKASQKEEDLSSSKNDKKNVQPESMQGFLDALNSYKYEYKNPKLEGAAPGQRYGIILEEMEKTPVGASIVIKDKVGRKMIDSPQSIGVILSALGSINKRIKKLES